MSVTDRLAAGQHFVEAIGARDFGSLESLLAPDARLRALVPGRLREEDGASAVVGRFRFWWEGMVALELDECDVAEVGGLVRARYRLRVDGPDDGVGIQEQTAYLRVEQDRIAAVDLVCTGHRSDVER